MRRRFQRHWIHRDHTLGLTLPGRGSLPTFAIVLLSTPNLAEPQIGPPTTEDAQGINSTGSHSRQWRPASDVRYGHQPPMDQSHGDRRAILSRYHRRLWPTDDQTWISICRRCADQRIMCTCRHHKGPHGTGPDAFPERRQESSRHSHAAGAHERQDIPWDEFRSHDARDHEAACSSAQCSNPNPRHNPPPAQPAQSHRLACGK